MKKILLVLLMIASTSYAAGPQFVQNCGKARNTSTGTGRTLIMPNCNVTPGNLLVTMCGWRGGGGQTPTAIHDNHSDLFDGPVICFDQALTSSSTLESNAENIVGGSTTVTLDLPDCSGATCYIGCNLLEFTPFTPSTTLQVKCNTNLTTTLSTGSITTHVANNLILSVVNILEGEGYSSGPTFGFSEGTDDITSLSFGNSSYFAYQSTNTTGTFSNAYTVGTGNASVGMILALDASPTPSPTPSETATPGPTNTPSGTPTDTSTPLPTNTQTATPTTTETPTVTSTSTATQTATATSTGTATQTATATSTGTATQTPTPRPTSGMSTSVFGNIIAQGYMKTEPMHFNELITWTPTYDGWLKYCDDCTATNPCAGGGTGAYAERINNIWICNGGASFSVPDPLHVDTITNAANNNATNLSFGMNMGSSTSNYGDICAPDCNSAPNIFIEGGDFGAGSAEFDILARDANGVTGLECDSPLNNVKNTPNWCYIANGYGMGLPINTVNSLPTCNINLLGFRTNVSDATVLSCVFNTAIAGGNIGYTCPVYCGTHDNGTTYVWYAG